MLILTWLFDGRALTTALIELEGQTGHIAEINKIVNQYHSMAKLHLGTRAIENHLYLLTAYQNMVPRVDDSLEYVRQHLFRQYEEVFKKTDSQKLDPLDPSYVCIFHEQISALLEATVGAFMESCRDWNSRQKTLKRK